MLLNSHLVLCDPEYHLIMCEARKKRVLVISSAGGGVMSSTEGSPFEGIKSTS